MTMRKLVLVLMLLLPTFNLQAESLAYTAEKLLIGFDAKKRLDLNTSTDTLDDLAKYVWNMGYVVGVRDTLYATGDACDTDISVEQLLAIVENRVRAHPEEWDGLALNPVMIEVFKNFPCDSEN